MRNKKTTLWVAILAANCILFSSCIGSFGLTKKLLAWNKEIDSKFVNELVFFAFHIVPVYPVSYVADLLVINAIEFWKGENPVSDLSAIDRVETENGIYLVETHNQGYTITKEDSGEILDLVFYEEDNSWGFKYHDYQQKLFKYTDGDEVVMFLPDGTEMEVSPNQAGIRAFREQVLRFEHYALR